MKQREKTDKQISSNLALIKRMERDFTKKPRIKEMLDPSLKFDETKERFEQLSNRNIFEPLPPG